MTYIRAWIGRRDRKGGKLVNFKGFLKTGAVLITSTLILTGCGNSSLAPEKKTSAVQSTTQQPEKPSVETTTPTTKESNSASTGTSNDTSKSSSRKSLSQVDTDLDQVEQTIDKTLDSLDQTLDSLDFNTQWKDDKHEKNWT